MDLSYYRDAAVLVSTLLSIGGVVYIWLTSKSSEAHKLASTAHDEIKALQRRADALETGFAHLPTKEEFHALKLSLAEFRGALDVVSERMRPIGAISERLQELLLEMGTRK